METFTFCFLDLWTGDFRYYEYETKGLLRDYFT